MLEMLADVTSGAGLRTLSEGRQLKQGVLRTVGGTFSVCEEVSKTDNRNGRLYSRRLLENRIVGSPYTREMLEARTLFGEPGHPRDRMDIDIGNVSHVITELRMEPNGNVWGSADVLDTPAGRILQTLFECGSKIGISSRGAGRTTREGGRDRVDEESYQFVTYDAVLNPGFGSARLGTITESAQIQTGFAQLLEHYSQGLAHRNLGELALSRSTLNTLYEATGSQDLLPIMESVDAALAGTASSRELLEARDEIRRLTAELTSRRATDASESDAVGLQEENHKLRMARDIYKAEVEGLRREVDNSLLIMEEQQRQLKAAQAATAPVLESVATEQPSVADVEALLETVRAETRAEAAEDLAERLEPLREDLRCRDNALEVLTDAIVEHVAKVRGVDPGSVLRSLPEGGTVGDFEGLLAGLPVPAQEVSPRVSRFLTPPVVRPLVEASIRAEASVRTIEEEVKPEPRSGLGRSRSQLAAVVRRLRG